MLGEEFLHDTFEYKGMWFLPESKNIQVCGTLEYSKGDIILSVTVYRIKWARWLPPELL